MRPHTWLLLLFCVLLPLGCFGWIAQAVWNRNGLSWDVACLQSIHRYATPARDQLMVLVTYSGDIRAVIILGMIGALLLVARQQPKDARFLARCIVGTIILGYASKTGFHRIRPHLWQSPAPEQDFGFPSGHAMESLALASGLAVIAWRSRWRYPVIFLGLIYVLAVGLSRLYLGVHYPSDVLASWALAGAWMGVLILTRGTDWAVIRIPRKEALFVAAFLVGLAPAFIERASAGFANDHLHNTVTRRALVRIE
jgi:membrane-associated phospholipid phosphatase